MDTRDVKKTVSLCKSSLNYTINHLYYWILSKYFDFFVDCAANKHYPDVISKVCEFLVISLALFLRKSLQICL